MGLEESATRLPACERPNNREPHDRESDNREPDDRAEIADARFPRAFAGVIAAVGWTALVLDFCGLLTRFRAAGRGVGEAMFAFLRFFTIETNAGVALLMSVAALGWLRSREAPRPELFRAATVYMAVTCVTYEWLLRGLWSPRGVQFWTDLTFHDLQPALTLLFWASAAPKQGLRWTTLPPLLLYPTAYFAVTLCLGAAGAGYPYPFLDVGRLGYAAVLVVGLLFLAVFLVFGAALTTATRMFKGGRSPPAGR